MPGRISYMKCIDRAALAAALTMLMTSCKTPEQVSGKPGQKDSPEAEAAESVNVDFLLSMSFDEAAAITKSRGEVPGVARVAADSIEVVKFGKNGEARRLRAKGHVFVEMDGGGDSARALSQEAYITESEVILRGRPVLQRGGGLLEGTTDHTVFYIFDNQVRAIGRHNVKSGLIIPTDTPEAEMVMSTMRGSTGVPPRLPEVGPWRSGPNPLLPPLDDTAVPAEVREEMRRQAEAEAVLQQAKGGPGELPTDPLNLPSAGPVPAEPEKPKE